MAPFPKFEMIVITLSNDEYWIRHNSGSIMSLTLLPSGCDNIKSSTRAIDFARFFHV